jgi:hypothetical protein
MQDNASDDPQLRIEVFDRSQLDGLVPHWYDLISRAVDENIYYAPDYALPLLNTVDRNQNVKLVTVWDQKTLVALLPVVARVMPVPGVAATGVAWSTEHTYCCLPVLDKACAQLAFAGLLDGLADIGKGEWVIPKSRLDGPTAVAMFAVLDQKNIPWKATSSIKRAVLSRGTSFEEHMQNRVGSKRRRELARSRRRLEELGLVTHSSVTAGPEHHHALDVFLKIEAGGWKGKRGTALACNPSDESFAKLAFGAKTGQSNSRIDLLLLNEVPIAAGVTIFSGRTGFTVKSAYDEKYAPYSAGLLLEVEVLKSFLSEAWADRLDSGTSGNHVIDDLWPDSIEIADIVFSLAASAPHARLRLYMKMQLLQEYSKRKLKALLGR